MTTFFLVWLVGNAILIRPALKIAVHQARIIMVAQTTIMVARDLVLKDPDTMRVLQQNQQLAVPAAIIILVAQTTIMAVLTIMVTRA
jgi:hypothetical protein